MSVATTSISAAASVKAILRPSGPFRPYGACDSAGIAFSTGVAGFLPEFRAQDQECDETNHGQRGGHGNDDCKYIHNAKMAAPRQPIKRKVASC